MNLAAVDNPKTGTNLQKAIQQRKWSDVLSRIVQAPHEATYTESRLMGIPLHEACMRKPPAVVVSSLIASYPVGSSTKCDNNLAIHYALKYGAALSVIQTLIISCPQCVNENDAEGNTPKEIFKKSKNTWNHKDQTLISKMLEGGAKIDLDTNYVTPKKVSRSIPSSTPSADVGLYGLAVMGQNFALNMASHGFTVCVGNRSPTKVAETVKRAKGEGNLPIIGSSDPEDFIMKLKRPRKVILLVQAGKPVDLTIEAISKYMEPGDIIVDGGNEWYPNTIRRGTELEAKGILFVGMGISGGEEGARNGPSLMPGGPKKAYDELEPILTRCAAQVSDGACSSYVGPIGSGNYVKMVHNGIEYGDMQLIGEAYDIMKNVLGMTNDEMSKVFADWNAGYLESYLIEITAEILAKRDDITTKGHVVDYVLDKTGMKGTGKWTIQEAAEQLVAAPTISGSLNARFLSGIKDERIKASKILHGPSKVPQMERQMLIDKLGEALYASKICSYAQGLGIIKAASDKFGWNIDLAPCVKLWKGGCIIRAKLLDKIQAAFTKDPNLPNLMLDSSVAKELGSCNQDWRDVVMICALSGIACPSIGGSLTYYDAYRALSSPANLTQAHRDFFGGHTYERNDLPGIYHCKWTDAHKDIGNINERMRGEKEL